MVPPKALGRDEKHGKRTLIVGRTLAMTNMTEKFRKELGHPRSRCDWLKGHDRIQQAALHADLKDSVMGAKLARCSQRGTIYRIV
jgi:hypothetical protein